MKKYFCALILVILLVSITHAQPNPSQVAWTTGSLTNAPLAHAGSGVLGNYFYCFGGASTIPILAQAYNLTTGAWEESTPPLFGNRAYTAVATNDAIYLICRQDSNGGPIGSEVQKFTPINGGSLGTWTQMASYPQQTFQIAAAWDGGNYIYAAGGITGSVQAYKYTISGDAWTPIANMPQWRNAAGGAFVAGKFYMVGGWPVNSPTLAYNPATNSWAQKAMMPVWVPLVTWNTTSNNNLVYVIGGGGYTAPPVSPATNAVQVYDPVANRWEMETPLPAAQAFNNARFVPPMSGYPARVISAGGGFSSAPSSVTYVGTGFPLSSPLPGVTVTLTATGSTNLSQNGGKVRYNIQYRNGGMSSVMVDVWVMVTMTTGSQTGPYLNLQNQVLAPGASYSQNGTVTVPRTWAGGTYYMDGYAGEYNPPNNILYSADHFSFVKFGASPNGYEITEGMSTVTPSEFALLGARPNPFNPTTVARYELRVASNVSLRVYNTAGRLMATLVDGWREAGSHEVTFDGSNFASGIYLARLQAGDFVQTQKLVLMK